MYLMQTFRCNATGEIFGDHRAKMKNCQGTKGAPCYFSTLDTMLTPLDEITLRILAPYPSY